MAPGVYNSLWFLGSFTGDWYRVVSQPGGRRPPGLAPKMVWGVCFADCRPTALSADWQSTPRVLLFGLLSSSLLLFLQRFGRYVFWRLKVKSWLQANKNTWILNSCTRLWLTESEQATSVDSIKDVVWSSPKVPEFDKHLKKAGGQICRNVVEITIKVKTIVWKPLMIEIVKICLRNFDNYTSSGLKTSIHINCLDDHTVLLPAPIYAINVVYLLSLAYLKME